MGGPGVVVVRVIHVGACMALLNPVVGIKVIPGRHQSRMECLEATVRTRLKMARAQRGEVTKRCAEPIRD